jgi:hypothetical protein
VTGYTTTRTGFLHSAQARRSIALGVTSVLLLLSYATLRIAALPRANFIDRHYDDINWTRFLPKPRPIIIPEATEPVPEKPRPQQLTAEIAEVTRAPERLDLSAELKELEIDLAKPASPQITAHGAEAQKPSAVTRETMPSLLESDLNANLSFDVTNLDTRLPGAGRRSGNEKGSGIRVGSGGQTTMSGGLGESNNSTDAGLGIPGRGNSSRGKGGEAAAKVDLKGLSHFGENYRNFTPIYRALLEWMRRHPVDLPEVVDRFMGFQAGNLTSRVVFSIGGREFEMLLLCVESTYEVRIALVEGDEVTYLIDQGFKKQSNYLRIGSLARQPDGEIHRFGSVLREASDRRTQEFYQVFLSWWDTVKDEVGGR